MRRYDGSWLGETPHIVVLGSRKLGNFIATLPLLRCLREEYLNSKLDFWGSNITKSLEESLIRNKKNGVSINWRISWDNGLEANDISEYIENRGNPDLLINCDGFNPTTGIIAALLSPKWVSGNAMRKDLTGKVDTGTHIYQKVLDDREWNSEKFLQKYSGSFVTQYIGEIFCRMAFMNPTMEDLKRNYIPTEEPEFEVPEVLIHCTTTRSAKLWREKYWHEILDWCKNYRKRVGLIGAIPSRQKNEYNSGLLEENLLKKFEEKGAHL